MNEPIIAQREVTRHILSSFGIRTQKKLGQHFLVDEAVVSAIAAALELQPGMPVLEIGPGIGTLTLQLALTGVRELSIIASPPVDRLAVRTFVAPHDPLMIREAPVKAGAVGRKGETWQSARDPRIEANVEVP